jgi:hypothetical protein
LAPPSLHAGAGAGTGGAPLAAHPVGARPLALGAAYVALADDALAPFWNPAGLGWMRGAEVLLSAQREPGEVTYSYLAGAVPVRPGLTAAVGAGALRTPDLPYVDLTGNPGSAAGQSDWLGVVSAAVTLLPLGDVPDPTRFSVTAGVSLKALRSDLGQDAAGSGGTADLGLLAGVPALPDQPALRLGAAALNAAGRVRRGGRAERVASPWRLGIAQTVVEGPATWTTATLDVQGSTRARGMEVHAGAEQAVKSGRGIGLALRLGYRAGADLPGPAAGLGVRWGRFVFDYAAALVRDLGVAHRAGLRVSLAAAPEPASER